MKPVLRGLAAVVLAALAACGGEEADAHARLLAAEERPKPGALPERSATHPASPCDWITPSEVEAVVGRLSGPPRKHEGGCFYPLPLDTITLARQAKTRQVEEALARAGMQSDWPPMPEDTGGVLIRVSVGVGAQERPSELGFATVGSWAGNDSLRTAPPPGEGWDYRTSIIGKPNFFGRAGTVMVTVEGGTYGMDRSLLAVLAGRVRDRIPDLPFVEPDAAPAVPPGPDPCRLLTLDEAEAVLGAPRAGAHAALHGRRGRDALHPGARRAGNARRGGPRRGGS
jgi:hypothetical protein